MQMLEDLITVRIVVRHLGSAALAAAAILYATADELIAARGLVEEPLGDDVLLEARARAGVDRHRVRTDRNQRYAQSCGGSHQSRLAQDHHALHDALPGRGDKARSRERAQPSDRKLIANIAAALGGLDRIRAGKTYTEIASADGVP